MKDKISILLLLACFTASGLVAGCKTHSDADAKAGADTVKAGANTAMSPIDRGKYLVTVASCNDCHTPLKMGPKGPEPDMTRMLSGHPEDMKMPPPPKPVGPWIVAGGATLTAWSGPWGTSFTANLTPDSATGIGKWDEATFILAIRNGKFIGSGRDIMPPMPWQWIKNMTDDDLKAVYAYLRTIPAIHNKVPDYIPPTGGPMMAGGPEKKP